MEALNIVREAIESLSHDEKIDEGKYLELMNHLQTVYGSLPQPQRSDDVVRRPINSVVPRDPESEIFAIHNNLFTRALRDREMLSQVYGRDDVRGELTASGFAHILEVVVSARNKDLEWEALVRELKRYFTEAYNGTLFVYAIKKFNFEFANADERETFINLPFVRELHLTHVIQRKSLYNRLLPIIKDVNNEDQWAELMHKMGFGFMNQMKYDARKGECKPRTEAELKKLHLVEIAFNMVNDIKILVHRYTDKIQLGRTKCVPELHRMAMVYALLHPEMNAPLEGFLKRSFYGDDYCPFPMLATSGITAKTRNKSRLYESMDGYFTITYLSTLNDVGV